jgi:hypothetical protein
MITSIAHLKPLEAYSIFCGVTRTSPHAIEGVRKNPKIQEWQTHVFENNSANIKYDDTTLEQSLDAIKDLEGFYYLSFVNCLFPIFENSRNKFTSSIKDYTFKIFTPIRIEDKNIFIEYLDLFFFPENLLVYCFKCKMTSYSFDEIISINDTIRNLAIDKIDCIHNILKSLIDGESFNFGNKLKLFCVIEHDITFNNEYSEDNLIFDISTCSPVGSSIGDGRIPSLKPSNDYYNHIMSMYKLSVFDNWTALCLFDTFTMLHRGELYNYNWEFRYFRLLYIHSIFIKAYLIELNSEFYLDYRTRDVENIFHEFNKHFNLKQVSYNFLPQLIYEKIRQGLNIDHELNNIRLIIEQDYKVKQDKSHQRETESEKRTNMALNIVAVLAVFTAVWDGAEWIEAVISGKRGLWFNIISVICFCGIYSAIFFLLGRRNRQ